MQSWRALVRFPQSNTALSSALLTFTTLATLSLSAAALAATRSKEFVFSIVTTLTILTSLTAGYLVEIGGWTISLSSAFYGGVYLGIDALTEFYRKVDAKRAVYYALVANGFLLASAVVFATLAPAGLGYASSVQDVFGFVPRVVVAALVAFAVSSRIEIDLYAALRRRFSDVTGGLALRSNISTIVAQGVDSALFFGIAFYGLVDWPKLIELALFGWAIRTVVALADTPLLYLVRVFKPARKPTRRRPAAARRAPGG